MKASTILSAAGFTALASASAEYHNQTTTHTTFLTHTHTPKPMPTGIPTGVPTGAPNSTRPYGLNPHGARAAASSFIGDFTWYNVGLGACGTDSSGQDMAQNIVALNYEQMGDQSNNNPYCGRTITISGNGKTTTGTILDKCMGCSYGDIDVSEKAFLDIFGTLDVGRGQVTWWFN